MTTRDLSCPICQADLPLDGDEKPGDEVICSYCGAPSRITGRPDDEASDWEVEEEEY
jgi:predicted amidophosphoribosyltransferase